MRQTGESERPGEVLHQAGATATSMYSQGKLVWQVRDHRTGNIAVTEHLAHTSHWEPEHRWELPR